jgi:4-hydroxybenzoate polyprenyltransferase
MRNRSAEGTMNEIPQQVKTEPPLYVDLDGTLIRSDLFLESLFALIKAQPLCLFLLPFWLLRGRAYLKGQLARRVRLDPTALNYDDRLMSRLRADHARRRRIVLATASDRRYAEAVAGHVGLFDAVLASEERRNLKAHRKLEAILTDSGGGPFDYAGNETADLPIWKRARIAIIVNASRGVIAKARRLSASTEIIERPRGSWLHHVLKAIRVHQWLKNALIFLPLFAGHQTGNLALDMKALAAFFAFGFCASSIYVLNDLSDLEADRRHPRKRRRPFASGALPLAHGMALIPVLLLTSLIIATGWRLPLAFFEVLGVYYVSSLFYNFLAKDRVIWDVIVLAGLYALRVLAGVAATGIPPSFWLLAFSMFIFLSLALVKRYAEMLAMQKLGKSQAHGRGYVTDDMPVLQSMGVASGYMAVLVMALYLNSPEVHHQYLHPRALWAICPFILFWVSWIWLKTHRGQMHDDPVVFAATDRLSLFVGLACVASLALAGPL